MTDARGSRDALASVIRLEGRMVLATLVRLTGDLGVAEDAVQDASMAALQEWPRTGVPAEPRAWLIVAAKRRAIDRLRRDRIRPQKEREATLMAVQTAPDAPEPSVVRDDQLRLVFTCCHPALAPEAQVALALRTLCGLSVGEVARALLVNEATMAKRLVRVRAKIADAGIPYRIPDEADLPERLRTVATTVFLMFNEAYASRSDGPHERRALADEAVRLGRLLVELMPGEAALEGLLATMLLQHSRRDARTDAAGELVLLADQDRSRWDRAMIAEGVDRAARAIRLSSQRPERFAVTAAIAACHAMAPDAASTDWTAILSWYDVLLTLDPSPVVALNRAAAVAEVRGPGAGLEELDRIAGLDRYPWAHGLRAELLARLGRHDEATDAARQAIALTDSPAQRRQLALRFPPVEGP
ncbi:RNA polymerase sigma factor [Agromyces indicus]|uniref:Sigma-70 family RNA polymerase sigma factor n=1 Tax=Agromyces indicus TaxID=758919 RepID=A0ABU1FI06_9MICO|nr:sigma-70 family RNA polymerase sigma factor [Agromyces indicus]MDR5691046.1 sigma-70 family RNA polymerase sigma factor [Agromyces indicus]